MKTIYRFLILLLILFSCEKKVTRYTLTTLVSPTGSGTISLQNGIFNKGETVVLEATPSGLYTFKEWDVDANPCKFESCSGHKFNIIEY